MQKITTIFWDLDGTLVNNEALYDQAIEFACNQANCNMVRRINDLPNGQTLQADFSFITNLNGYNSHDYQVLVKLTKLAISYMKANFNNTLIIKPTVKLFNYFHQLGLQQSIVSNSNQELCEFIINKIEIGDKCRYCFGIENVQFGKPNPQLYLHALNIHNINSVQCLAFEDSANGIKAAKAANLTVIGVGLSSAKINPNYCWNIESEDFSKVLRKLSNVYILG
jgi:beta-phosphoglucomutase-like phosphatase (HAD superfamily)